MVKLRSLIFTVLSAWAACASNIANAENSALTLGFDIGSPPFFDMKNGCPSGIYPLITGAIFQDAGQPIIGYPAPFRRVLAKLDLGVWGAGGILKTPERMAKYDYTDAIYVENNVIYFNRKKQHDFQTLADLQGKRIGVVQGWSYGEKLDELINNKFFSVEAVNSDLTNFKKLKLGRIDALITIRDVGASIMAKGEFDDLAISRIPVFSNSTYIAFKKNSIHENLIRRLNYSIKKLNNTGQLAYLVKSYLQNLQDLPSGENFEEGHQNLNSRAVPEVCYLRGNTSD
ncbi:substrate-binding periplasmic protein [Duganella qianjiadongensis]|uniref:Transporter substrate-binding domain-containing protein n=1 Tax=Duganella qianjiadongensis TaxID=2692176 RepID=A0ABW9VE77_9BURK|nr:transporter substrate-binding domain-containing protein [Duganella qianjiadongensis]MYM37926.1 transporter substrate-binding domain-containing protein [Duganella qianjiadongensis]